MSKPRIPRSTEQATSLLARYAVLSGELQGIEQERAVKLSAINSAHDHAGNPLIAEMEAIEAVLVPWYLKDGKALCAKGAKSIELGGCMIGSRKGKSTVAISGSEEDVVALLSGLRWAKPLLRVKTSLNKAAIMTALDGPRRVALVEMGIERREGVESVFIERTEQGGTLGGQ